jgi:hypothetical protein
VTFPFLVGGRLHSALSVRLIAFALMVSMNPLLRLARVTDLRKRIRAARTFECRASVPGARSGERT